MSFRSQNERSTSSDIVLENVYVYTGEHSVTFTRNGISKNTWHDWGLIPSSRPSKPANGLWSRTVSVDGVNGQEDLVREYPYASVNSYSRLRSAIVHDNPDNTKTDNGYDLLMAGSGTLSYIIADQTNSFFVKQQELLNFLHNQSVSMVFSDDPTVTYQVRTTIESLDNGAQYSNVSIKYTIVNEN